LAMEVFRSIFHEVYKEHLMILENTLIAIFQEELWIQWMEHEF
jgi:hypothetical protein